MCCRPCDRGRAVTVTKDVANPFSFTWTIHTFVQIRNSQAQRRQAQRRMSGGVTPSAETRAQRRLQWQAPHRIRCPPC